MRWPPLPLLLLGLWSSSCFDPSAGDGLPCGDGLTCPLGQRCDVVATGVARCVDEAADAGASGGPDASRDGPGPDAGPTPDASSATCPAGYQMAPTRPDLWYRPGLSEVPYTVAVAMCQADGPSATLAAARDSFELALLSMFDPTIDEIWAGLRRDLITDTWVEADGTAASLLPWQAGFPGALGSGADCVALRPNQRYVTRSCSEIRGFVCVCRR